MTDINIVDTALTPLLLFSHLEVEARVHVRQESGLSIYVKYVAYHRGGCKFQPMLYWNINFMFGQTGLPVYKTEDKLTNSHGQNRLMVRDILTLCSEVQVWRVLRHFQPHFKKDITVGPKLLVSYW